MKGHLDLYLLFVWVNIVTFPLCTYVLKLVFTRKGGTKYGTISISMEFNLRLLLCVNAEKV